MCVCGVRRMSAVSEMSDLQSEKRKCAVLGESHLQDEEKAV